MTRIMNMDLIYRFFDAVNMHRWNDHLRPIDLTEVDKQAHKAAIAWILGKYEEHENGTELDWTKIIEGSMFSFLKRTVLTDLKPQLLHRMESEKFDAVNDYVIKEVRREIPDIDEGFMNRFEEFIRGPATSLECRILDSAHYLATKWEFNIIYEFNKHSFEIEETKKEIDKELNSFIDLIGVKKVLNSKSKTFIDLIAQLRFQQRWTRVPRMPATTVLGHSLLVATMAYLHDLEVCVDKKQAYNDYYTGLFHDIPEVLTKDVISPVKANVEGLVELLDEYEHEMIESRMMPLIPDCMKEEFRFLLFNPFGVKNDPKFGKVAGKELKMCDVMGAFIEANVSRRYGVASAKLKEGEKALRTRLEKEGDCINASDLLRRLDEMQI